MAQRRLHVHGLDTKTIEIEDDNGLEVMTLNTVTPGVTVTGTVGITGATTLTGNLTQTGNQVVTGTIESAGAGGSVKAPVLKTGDSTGATSTLTFYAYSDDELSVATEYEIEIVGGIITGVTATPVEGGE